MPTKPAMPHGDLLISPEHRAWVETALNELAEIELPDDLAAADDEDEAFWSPEAAWARPYKVRNGDLIVPVRGVLLHKFPYAFGAWATGYEYIVAAVKRGVGDSNVQRIVLHVDSPGGIVSGCFDAVDAIYELRGTKPVVAVADEHAYSAAYAIASAADEIVVARTGGVGSIGVINAHVEMSRMLDQDGITVSLIFAGEKKADGHPATPLSESARARIQERVNSSYQIFVSTVARNRGLDEEAVRATEADCFMAQEAVENGLADMVGNLGTLSANAENSPETEDDTMSKDTDTAVDQAAHEAAVTAATEAGRAEGAQAERARIAAIMDSDEAKARPKAARQVALKTDMTVEAAKGFLADLDEEKAAAPAPEQSAKGQPSAFEEAMSRTSNPNLAGEGDEDSDEGELTDAQVADSVFASIGLPARK